MSNNTQQSKHLKTNSGKENCSFGEPEPPPKRRCKVAVDKHSCGPCTVWIQTGSNPEQLRHHNMRSRIRHPGDKAFQFSLYLSCNNTYKISLRSDSCLCNACYIDCERATGKPRWLGLSKHFILKHCILCCQGVSDCLCNTINEWGPEKWYDSDNELQLWLDYFRNSAYSLETSESCMGFNLCKTHYVTMRTAYRARVCQICKNDTTKWYIGENFLELLGPLKDDYNVASNDWVCEDIGSPKCTGNHKSRFFFQVRQDGVCLIKDIVNKYKSILESKYSCINDGEYDSFKKYLAAQLKEKGYDLYYPTKKEGSMCYNPLVISQSSLLHVYRLLRRQTSQEHSNLTEQIRTIRRQVKLFPTSIKFDFRKLFNTINNSCELEKYFDTHLLQFVRDVTRSGRIMENRNISSKHMHSRNMKCMMVCAILANMMDTRSCFLQTLIGLACYAQGLRDKGMKFLNAFGITSSVSHIRDHGNWWAKIRKAIKEIDIQSFWRVTFDNLDFKMKKYRQVGVN